ncbi:MAG: Methionine aminopeptidase [Parcubacteria group bacterium]|nr:Methionine aminopeptidase [Parcubacteria group bacterium]
MIKLKSKEDIDILKEGGKRNAEILRLLAGMVRPGLSTLDLEQAAAQLLEEQGDKSATLGYTPAGARRPYPANLCVSINEEIVHGIPNEDPKILKEGDIVTIDLSMVHKGLFTDSALTVAVGEIDEGSRKLVTATRTALEKGIARALPGKRMGDISEAIQDHAEAAGFNVAEDLAGHGVGFALHEDPFVPNEGKAGQGPLLKPGMVIAIEPMLCAGKGAIKVLKDGYTIVTKDSSRSAHFEHTVAITETGNIILTS